MIANHMYIHIFFDLDGTLSDSSQGIVAAYRAAFDVADYTPRFDPSTLIGTPLYESMLKLLVDEQRAGLAVNAFRKHYSSVGYKQAHLYDGIEELLFEFHKEERHLHIVTAKPTIYAEKVLSHFGIRPYISSVNGINLDDVTANKAGMINQVLEQFLVGTNKAVMVGDRAQDILAAQLTGVASIGVLYGYGTAKEIRDAQPNFIVETVPALRTILIQK